MSGEVCWKSGRLVSVAVMVSMLLVGFAPLHAQAWGPETFEYETAQSGYVHGYDTFYPNVAYSTEPDPDYFYVGQKFATGAYDTWRDFLSFDTSSIPDDTVIGGATLSLYLANDYSTADFTVDVYSSNYTYLDGTARSKQVALQGSLFNTSGVSAGAWYSVNVSVDSISLTGDSRYSVVSDRELSSVTPTTSEYIRFSGYTSANVPKLDLLEAGTMSWVSVPVVMMNTTAPYEWDACTDQDGLETVTYSLSTNATFLSIDEDTGVLSGSDDAAGEYYWVEVTASADGFYDLSVNYTLTVMDDIYVDPYTHGMYAYGANIVQYGNRVYMAYLSNVENDEGTYYMYLMAKEYDGSNWSDGVRIAYVGEADGSPFNVSGGGPTICRDGAGYLHLFFSGTEDWQIFCYYRSDSPDSVASWTYMEDMLTNRGYVYPGTFQYATYDPKNDQLWLFYLYYGDEGELRAINSSDGGATWGRLYWDDYLILIDAWDSMDIRGDNVYMTKEGDDYYVNFPFVSIDQDGDMSNAYFFKFNLTDRHMYNASGTDLGGSEISWTFASRNTSILVYRNDSMTHISGVTVATAASGRTVAVLSSNGTYKSLEWDGVAWANMTDVTDVSTGGNYNSTVGFLWNEGSTLVAVLTTADFGDDDDVTGQGYGGDVTRWAYDEDGQSWSQLPSVLNATQSFAGSFNYLLRGTDASYAKMANVFGAQAMYPETGADEDLNGPWGVVVAGFDYAGRLTVVGNGTRLAQWAPTVTPAGNATQDYETYLLYDAETNETTNGLPVFGMETDAAFLSIDATTGVVDGTVDAGGVYYVHVSCLSIFGLGTGWQNFTLTIIGGTGAPAIDNAPDSNTTAAWVGWHWNATCTAPDSGDSTWALDTNATGLSVGFENDTSANVSGTVVSIGSYYVNLTVNDSDSSSWYNFTLYVVAGELPSITTEPHPLNATEDSAWYYLAGADYAIGETWGMATNASWISRSYNNFSGTPTNEHSERSFYLNVTVTSMNGTDYQNVTVFVYNNAPAFTSTPTGTGENGTEYSYDATASDEGGTAWYFLASDYPWGGIFDFDTGELAFTPNVTGIFWFNITFDDDSGAANSTAYQNFTVTVSAAETPSVIPIVFELKASFVYSLDGYSVACTDTSFGPVVSWVWDFGDGYVSFASDPVHTYEQPGAYVVSLTVADAWGRTSSCSAEVEIASPDIPYEWLLPIMIIIITLAVAVVVRNRWVAIAMVLADVVLMVTWSMGLWGL